MASPNLALSFMCISGALSSVPQALSKGALVVTHSVSDQVYRYGAL